MFDGKSLSEFNKGSSLNAYFEETVFTVVPTLRRRLFTKAQINLPRYLGSTVIVLFARNGDNVVSYGQAWELDHDHDFWEICSTPGSSQSCIGSSPRKAMEQTTDSQKAHR